MCSAGSLALQRRVARATRSCTAECSCPGRATEGRPCVPKLHCHDVANDNADHEFHENPLAEARAVHVASHAQSHTSISPLRSHLASPALHSCCDYVRPPVRPLRAAVHIATVTASPEHARAVLKLHCVCKGPQLRDHPFHSGSVACSLGPRLEPAVLPWSPPGAAPSGRGPRPKGTSPRLRNSGHRKLLGPKASSPLASLRQSRANQAL